LKLARTLRHAAVLGTKDFARYITSLTVSIEDDRETRTYLEIATAYSEILAAARNLRCLDVHNSELSLSALVGARQTSTDCLQEIVLKVNEIDHAAVFTYIGYFTHLQKLDLWFESRNSATTELELGKHENLSWSFPRLHTLVVDFQCDVFLPIAAHLLGNSDFPLLEDMTFLADYYCDTPAGVAGAKEYVRFFTRHFIHKFSLHAPNDITSALLPHIDTVCLEVTLIDSAVVSHLPRAVTKLHAEGMGFEDDTGEFAERAEWTWEGLDLLLHQETGVREVTTDEWRGTTSWIDFLNLENLNKIGKRSQLQRLRYATLLAAKGIRFVDPQGKTPGEYAGLGF
jgi:hypothetical protein